MMSAAKKVEMSRVGPALQVVHRASHVPIIFSEM